MRGPNSLRVSTIAPRTSGRRRVDCAPANLRKTIEIVPDEGATIPDPDPFPIMRGDLMELMQTGRRRWGRPTRARSPTRGRRGYAFKISASARAQALGTFATARHILGGRPVRPPGRPSAVLPLQVRPTDAVWIFQRDWIAFEAVSWICTSNQPQLLSPPASRIAI